MQETGFEVRSKNLWLTLLVTAFLVGNGYASSVTVKSSLDLGGGAFEWFTYDTTGAAPSTWWRESKVSLNTTTTSPITIGNSVQDAFNVGAHKQAGNGAETDWTYPGSGGQDFDIEQGFFGYAGNSSGGILYIGLVTGFDPGGVVFQNANYLAGDFFLDFAGTGAYDLAFGTSDDTAPGPETSTRIGQAWDLSNPWTLEHVNVVQHRPISDPFRVNTGKPNTSYGTLNTNYDVEWLTNILGTGDHNLLQIGVKLNATQAAALYEHKGFDAHWTMTCGNDILPMSISMTIPFTPVVPLPAAASLAGLGIAIVGIARRKRQAKASR